MTSPRKPSVIMKTPSLTELTGRFKDIIPDDEKTQELYKAAPDIKTQITISHAKKGELKIVCENAKYAQYLVKELRKLGDKQGRGFRCFYANQSEDCGCFYIMASELKVEGQNTQTDSDERIHWSDSKPQQETPKNKQPNFYGVYESKGDMQDNRYTGKNKKLSLRCPPGTANTVRALLGLKSKPKAMSNHESGEIDELCNDTLYFSPQVLPYQPGNNAQQIKTEITINTGLRPAVTEVKDSTAGSSRVSAARAPSSNQKTYTGDDAALVLKAALKMTAPGCYFVQEDKQDETSSAGKNVFIFDGIAHNATSSKWQGEQENSIALKWVKDPEGAIKLAVSYRYYDAQPFGTSEKAACYLITFNKDNSMSAEFLSSSRMYAKDQSIASGGEVIDALTEWAKAFHTNSFMKKDQDQLSKKNIQEATKEWSAYNSLQHALLASNLVVADTTEAKEAFTFITDLYNTMQNSTTDKHSANYQIRLEATQKIYQLLQKEIAKPTTPEKDKSDSKTASSSPFKASISTETQQAIAVQVKIILDHEPTWKERHIVNKICLFCGILTVPTLVYNWYTNRLFTQHVVACVKDLNPKENIQKVFPS